MCCLFLYKVRFRKISCGFMLEFCIGLLCFLLLFCFCYLVKFKYFRKIIMFVVVLCFLGVIFLIGFIVVLVYFFFLWLVRNDWDKIKEYLLKENFGYYRESIC